MGAMAVPGHADCDCYSHLCTVSGMRRAADHTPFPSRPTCFRFPPARDVSLGKLLEPALLAWGLESSAQLELELELEIIRPPTALNGQDWQDSSMNVHGTHTGQHSLVPSEDWAGSEGGSLQLHNMQHTA